MKEAIAEGWTTKAGNKYQSLPELMLRYRAATFLIRTHAPEVMNVMHMVEEIEDVRAAARDVTPKAKTLSAKLDDLINKGHLTTVGFLGGLLKMFSMSIATFCKTRLRSR